MAVTPAAQENVILSRHEERSWGWRTWASVALALLLAGLALNLAILPRTFNLSPADGLVYADAFDRALAGQVTVRGDMVGATTLDLAICRPPAHPLIAASVEWDCDPNGSRVPTWQTTAWVHPPTYFFIDAAATNVVRLVVPSADPFDVARVLGAFWFAAGGTLLVCLSCLWGGRPWPSAAVVAAFLPTPLFVGTFGYITPDRGVLIISTTTLIVCTLWWRGRLSSLWLALVGLMCGGVIKQTIVLAAFAGALLLAALWWQANYRGKGTTRTGRQTAVGIGLLLTSAAIGVLSWQLLKAQLGAELPPRTSPDFLTFAPGLDSAVALLFHGAYQIPLSDSAAAALEPISSLGLASLLTLLVAGAAFGALIYGSWTDRIFPMALAGVIAIGLGGLVIGVMGSVSSGDWLPPAPRYVMAAFPAYLLPLAVQSSRARVLVPMLAILLLGVASWALQPLY